EVIRSIESKALHCRTAPPAVGIEVDVPGIPISLPLERPLYDARPSAKVDSVLDPAEAEDLDVSALFTQTFVDHARLAGNIRAVVPARSSALLRDIVGLYPIEQGIAEIVGYLALTDEDLTVSLDEGEEDLIDYSGLDGSPRRARLPKVTVS